MWHLFGKGCFFTNAEEEGPLISFPRAVGNAVHCICQNVRAIKYIEIIMMKQTLWEFQHWRSSTRQPLDSSGPPGHINDNRASDHAEISAGTFLKQTHDIRKAGRRWKATFESSLITIHSLRKLTTMTFRGWVLQKWMSKKAKWMSKKTSNTSGNPT